MKVSHILTIILKLKKMTFIIFEFFYEVIYIYIYIYRERVYNIF